MISNALIDAVLDCVGRELERREIYPCADCIALALARRLVLIVGPCLLKSDKELPPGFGTFLNGIAAAAVQDVLSSQDHIA